MTHLPINLLEDSLNAVRRRGVTQLRRVSTMLRVARPGDRLWIREPYRFLSKFDGQAPLSVLQRSAREPGRDRPEVHFDADGRPGALFGDRRYGRTLPKLLHRHHLALIEVRVEPLHDITEHDAIAEGAASLAHYRAAWDRLHRPGSGRTVTGDAAWWGANPTTVVLRFNYVARSVP